MVEGPAWEERTTQENNVLTVSWETIIHNIQNFYSLMDYTILSTRKVRFRAKCNEINLIPRLRLLKRGILFFPAELDIFVNHILETPDEFCKEKEQPKNQFGKEVISGSGMGKQMAASGRKEKRQVGSEERVRFTNQSTQSLLGEKIASQENRRKNDMETMMDVPHTGALAVSVLDPIQVEKSDSKMEHKFNLKTKLLRSRARVMKWRKNRDHINRLELKKGETDESC
ncbi:hypothetical protein FRX31_010351 [Thalictrum thalictroides]|uniref:Uncharacterized protein n=1 Tax=Thalictrum thalictroides TaxID=46969 RepID=A0A7J6WRS6_THATH|nr:hypothetical protein FRX31_010351 [Thalictrum thalictroides]